jgi:hypothetical protein
MHVDKHVVKMILEYAQLLSTAHRILDGVETMGVSASGRKKRTWVLPDYRQDILYSATHINHPSAVWTRKTLDNYVWLSRMLDALCKEYTHRYGKIHKCERTGLTRVLSTAPKNIINSIFTEPTPAMPDLYKVQHNSIRSYENYYLGAKQRMFSWKNRSIPKFVEQYEKNKVDNIT